MTTTLGLDLGRGLDPAGFTIGGRPPRAALRPASREELAECLRACARDRLTAVPWGGGTGLAREMPPVRYDVALDLRGFDAIVEYDPEDLTLTAECGVTLASLRQALAGRGQELPIEGGFADRATLGGAMAANASGPRRLRLGSPRDRILGARFALSDGSIARTGGRVVKNVAGYGLHRMLCGSRGALAALLEVSLKLAPAPAARLALVYPASAAELADERRWAFLPRLEPAAATVLGPAAAREVAGLAPADGFTVVVLLEDERAWVNRQAQRVEEALGPAARRIEGDSVAGLAQALCDVAERGPRTLSFTTAWNSPAALGVIVGGEASPGLVFHSLAGRLHLESGTSEDTTSAVQRLAGSGFELIERSDAAPLESVLPQNAALGALRASIRRRLDPARVWAFGPRWEQPE